MCGIVGYIGDREATPLLLEGLKRLEYRGYDSAGVAVMNGQGVETRKAAGKSRGWRPPSAEPIAGDTGIAHTRWATHGAPISATPTRISDCKGHIAVVHNGIIENSTTLTRSPHELGHKFVSETDTEVIAHLSRKHSTETSRTR
jgi:glucosamine--fructose-6-phosphate aminotransferase (isomerizing)